ncbi:anti-sigma-F factor Fin family protein [Paenibacillus turpanensis]|uniref:anti-sigma-F factor Fin family protein n=1 Tax=Paenibacillus turpanensis TaxID=2689078 RepID=UPI00140929A5|nr:anti-sigma-F factor Fin family protein [Paenibacillus turpanensis]
MSVKYICRHCRSKVDEWQNHSQVDENKLGFHFLTEEERDEMISYDMNGDITVNVTCDYCRQALEANPELSLVPSPLQ